MEKNRIRPIAAGKNIRMSYSRQKEVLEMPNLIEVQKDSYKWFLDTGLREVFADVGSITDNAGILELSFIDYKELKRLFKKVPELSSYGGSTDEYKFKEAKPYENCDDVLMDLIRRFNITDKAALQDPELLKTIIYELQTRSGVSLRDVAVLVGLDREKIRRTAKKINYNV